MEAIDFEKVVDSLHRQRKLDRYHGLYWLIRGSRRTLCAINVNDNDRRPIQKRALRGLIEGCSKHPERRTYMHGCSFARQQLRMEAYDEDESLAGASSSGGSGSESEMGPETSAFSTSDSEGGRHQTRRSELQLRQRVATLSAQNAELEEQLAAARRELANKEEAILVQRVEILELEDVAQTKDALVSDLHAQIEALENTIAEAKMASDTLAARGVALRSESDNLRTSYIHMTQQFNQASLTGLRWQQQFEAQRESIEGKDRRIAELEDLVARLRTSASNLQPARPSAQFQRVHDWIDEQHERHLGMERDAHRRASSPTPPSETGAAASPAVAAVGLAMLMESSSCSTLSDATPPPVQIQTAPASPQLSALPLGFDQNGFLSLSQSIGSGPLA